LGESGTLADLMNMYAAKQRSMDETVAMWYGRNGERKGTG
jgi:hypothetical protein